MPDYSDIPVIPMYAIGTPAWLAADDSALQAANARGLQLKHPFFSAAPAPRPWYEVTREVGLYANVHRNGVRALREVSALELQQIVSRFTLAMEGLDADAAQLALTVAGKKYAQALDLQAKSLDLQAREQKLGSRRDTIQARIDALEADRAALETRREELRAQRERTNAQIEELKADLELQELEREQVEVDVLRETLRAENARLDVVDAALEGVRVQLQVNSALLDVARVPVKAASIKSDNARTDAQIARTELSGTDLELEQAQTGVAEARLDVQEARKKTLRNREDLIEEEATERKAILGLKTDAEEASLERIVEGAQATLDELRARIEASSDVSTIARLDYQSERTMADGDAALVEHRGDLQMGELGNRVKASLTVLSAAINAAEALAEADITNDLVHEISSA